MIFNTSLYVLRFRNVLRTKANSTIPPYSNPAATTNLLWNSFPMSQITQHIFSPKSSLGQTALHSSECRQKTSRGRSARCRSQLPHQGPVTEGSSARQNSVYRILIRKAMNSRRRADSRTKTMHSGVRLSSEAADNLAESLKTNHGLNETSGSNI